MNGEPWVDGPPTRPGLYLIEVAGRVHGPLDVTFIRGERVWFRDGTFPDGLERHVRPLEPITRHRRIAT